MTRDRTDVSTAYFVIKQILNATARIPRDNNDKPWTGRRCGVVMVDPEWSQQFADVDKDTRAWHVSMKSGQVTEVRRPAAGQDPVQLRLQDDSVLVVWAKLDGQDRGVEIFLPEVDPATMEAALDALKYLDKTSGKRCADILKQLGACAAVYSAIVAAHLNRDMLAQERADYKSDDEVVGSVVREVLDRV